MKRIATVLTALVVPFLFAGIAKASQEVPKPEPLQEMVEDRVEKVFNQYDEVTATKLHAYGILEEDAKRVRAEWVESYEDYQTQLANQEAAETPAAASAASAGGYSGDIYDALAQCESGGDPTTNTGNGYYGAFQFLPSTWNSFYPGLPTDYSYAIQKQAAIALIARSGWGQFPGCAAQLGML